MDDDMEFEADFPPSTEEQQDSYDQDIDLRDIDDVLFLDNIILQCTRVLKIDGAEVNEFKALETLLPGMSGFDRSYLCREVFRKIPPEQMDREERMGVYDWLQTEGPILVVRFLPYLSIACEMKFHRCEIGNYRGRKVFVPVVRNHTISTAIYYICGFSRQNIIAIFITNCAYNAFLISHSYRLLQTSTTDAEKIKLYKRLISGYTAQTKTLQFHQHLLLLSKWQEIYHCYVVLKRLGHNLNNIETLDYCRCLIMLSKYTAAEKRIHKLLSLSDKTIRIDEAWYLLAKAQRKRKIYPNSNRGRGNNVYYSKAMSSIGMAIRLNHANKEINEEKIIINNLSEERLLKEISVKSTIEHRGRRNECSSYNILSVDGGGIRGIMAAIWLRILELETNRTCSSMFQMMAGTSTGAIIAAGLSMPKTYSLREPAFDVAELVRLYRTCGRDIFVKKERAVYSFRNLPIFLASQYSSDGKRKMFAEFFREALLCDCLTDIVIPAVRSSDIYTHLFTKTDHLHSTRLVDVLMATTAAPTFFKPHCLNGTLFTDGGVQMNNPTLAAYTKAIEYGYKKEDIFVLSLGTGDHIQQPSAVGVHWDIVHYLKNHNAVLKVLLDSQQHNVDYHMSTLMNDDHYYRWQAWFEEPIQLDNYEPDILENLENIAYEYWEEMEIYDSTRLRSLITRLRDE